jgi:DNA-3-methyladenine glycosylase II
MSIHARRHLSIDPAFAALIRRAGPFTLRAEQQTLYEALVRAISHQQLHGNAARAILGRFVAMFPDAPFPSPEQVLLADETAIRACGFSASKIAAIRDICAKTLDGTVPHRRTALRLTDEQLIERLTSIRGVGRWTVEMLLIFTLGRTDILPVDDFGVRDGYQRLYGLEQPPKPRALAEIGMAWSPWRSIAAWYLWRASDEGKKVRLVPQA